MFKSYINKVINTNIYIDTDINIILNCILDPFSSFNNRLSYIKNTPLNINFDKYYKYINENIDNTDKLVQMRILNKFCYSINYFHVLLQYDIFPYDHFNNVYKILIADKMKYMYNTYYNIIFNYPINLSINTVKLYYMCLSLKRKINKYKLCGKLAWQEILQYSLDELNSIIDNLHQYKLIVTKNTNKLNILANQNGYIDLENINVLYIIKYCIFINNQLYLQQLINYVINNFKYIIYHINDYVPLLQLNNILYYNKLSNKTFESLLYNFIINNITDNILDKLDSILSITSANTNISKQLRDYRQSHILLNKI